MATSKEDILKAIEEMSVMDLVDLISEIDEKFGVSAAPAVAAAQAAAAESQRSGRYRARLVQPRTDLLPRICRPGRRGRLSRTTLRERPGTDGPIGESGQNATCAPARITFVSASWFDQVLPSGKLPPDRKLSGT